MSADALPPLVAVDPATGEEVARYPRHDAAAIEAALSGAAHAWGSWRSTDLAERTALLRRAAELLRAEAEPLAKLMAAEMGKPLAEGVAEAQKCAWVCDYYAEHAAAFLADEPAATDATHSYTAYRPLGPVLAVMPWNFPFWQVLRFAAPALAAGNVGLLKHASNVPGCALAVADLLRRAGAPEGAFTTLLVGSETVEGIIADRRVAAVTLTGSTPAGRAVAAAAGAHLKPTVLELGGSDPYVVLADADLDLAAVQCVTSRLINSGQSCIAAKRFIVERSPCSCSDFEELRGGGHMQRSASWVRPMKTPASTVGPHGARRPARRPPPTKSERQSWTKGARLLTGRCDPRRSGGILSSPTVLTDVQARECRPTKKNSSDRWRRSSPVADEEEGLRVANDTLVRSRRRGVYPGSRGPRQTHCGASRLRSGRLFRQRLREVAIQAPALRRHQGQRLRPRARPRRHPRFRQRQGGVRGVVPRRTSGSWSWAPTRGSRCRRLASAKRRPFLSLP